MAQSSPRPLYTDPLRNFKFNITIHPTDTSQSVGMANLGFMQMQGLGIQVDSLTYREGGDNLTTRKMPGQADFNPITLARGIFPTDYWNWYWMTQIFSAMYGGSNVPQTLDFRSTIYVNILEHPNNTQQNSSSSSGPTGAGPPLGSQTFYNNSWPQQSIVKVSFKLFSAWVSGLAYSDLDAGGNAVGVEQMQIQYEGFDVRWASGLLGAFYLANATSW